MATSRQPWWIKERHNPQLGKYYVAEGQMSRTEARKHEKTLYGYNVMLAFSTEKEYRDRLEELRQAGERIQP